MDRRRFALTAVGIAVLSGCGGGGGGGGGGNGAGFAFAPIGAAPPPGAPPAEVPAAPPPPQLPEPPAPPVPPAPNPPAPPAGPELATPTSLSATTGFGQAIDNHDNDRSFGPGQANFWDLTPSFGIESGWNDQFANAMMLSVKVGSRSAGFNGDQTFAELTALGPEMSAADGLKVVSITTDPAFQMNDNTAYLHAGAEVRLQQTIDLSAAVGRVNLSWNGTNGVERYRFSDEPAFMQVVLRDTAGSLLATFFRVDHNGPTGTWGFAWLTAYMGRVVVLSFEQAGYGQGTAIDDVTVSDFAPRPKEFIANGDFSAGLTGWTVSRSKASQNIRSGLRTLRGLQVQRTFYTQPNLQWARLTDTFHNPSASPVTAVATYTSFLGSYSAGVIYPTPAAPQKGLTVWDGAGTTRDAGFVFGAADAVSYASATMLNVADGSNLVTHGFNITMPAGGTVTLANFVVMTGTNTWIGAADTTARATDVDTQAAAIAAGFRTDVALQRGLTQLQLDTLKNF
jgi:hypothetical protein